MFTNIHLTLSIIGCIYLTYQFNKNFLSKKTNKKVVD